MNLLGEAASLARMAQVLRERAALAQQAGDTAQAALLQAEASQREAHVMVMKRAAGLPPVPAFKKGT